MRRAQSMGINMVVVAAIALLVLVIIAVIFGDKINDFFTESNTNCAVNGGQCLTAGEAYSTPGVTRFPDGDGSCGQDETTFEQKQCYVRS